MIEKVTGNIKSINDLILLKALGKAQDNHISFFYVPRDNHIFRRFQRSAVFRTV